MPRGNPERMQPRPQTLEEIYNQFSIHLNMILGGIRPKLIKARDIKYESVTSDFYGSSCKTRILWYEDFDRGIVLNALSQRLFAPTRIGNLILENDPIPLPASLIFQEKDSISPRGVQMRLDLLKNNRHYRTRAPHELAYYARKNNHTADILDSYIFRSDQNQKPAWNYLNCDMSEPPFKEIRDKTAQDYLNKAFLFWSYNQGIPWIARHANLNGEVQYSFDYRLAQAQVFYPSMDHLDNQISISDWVDVVQLAPLPTISAGNWNKYHN